MKTIFADAQTKTVNKCLSGRFEAAITGVPEKNRPGRSLSFPVNDFDSA